MAPESAQSGFSDQLRNNLGAALPVAPEGGPFIVMNTPLLYTSVHEASSLIAVRSVLISCSDCADNAVYFGKSSCWSLRSLIARHCKRRSLDRSHENKSLQSAGWSHIAEI